ncbi:RusA family crossover junction endodeoxyribonuclease [Tuwongella immobilis]|uniref:Uncharacterized protein n=1 Tax=Tuwongella immobilis TaxID=692036 RepID=A0A6C2YNZ2_9BACT|nr:RusA family crossover junction endodeoxyribonuclease [Tuwongella immobilis]VIP03087.1 crossover junction endodeoxyribonuclease : Uncharacterized protein OS=Candidatus Paracaedibacter acanthamoebae GN=ID47_03010 PE=4 SV=1: RusA [Tuwongella immobilis]VTS03348.1 crossover junction endodeoxyribonuclease : Uncharacterized protein OS=Candidatus Paracaedibacter acanthamoebae GN=ID47_03010 PE=4 SV=1: RusA [Tuwongella immobilis]
MTNALELELPYPPSGNHTIRHVDGRAILSKEARDYRKMIGTLLTAQGIRPMDGRLIMVIWFYPPDRRRRDADNVQKTLLDSLQKLAYHDDGQIDDLRTVRCKPTPGGKIKVVISPVTPEPEPEPESSTPSSARRRSCLQCGFRFASRGPANRICPTCSEASSVSERQLHAQRGDQRHNGVSLRFHGIGEVA